MKSLIQMVISITLIINQMIKLIKEIHKNGKI